MIKIRITPTGKLCIKDTETEGEVYIPANYKAQFAHDILLLVRHQVDEVRHTSFNIDSIEIGHMKFE